MKKIIFIKNAAILTVTAVLLRTVGMLFRVYLSNKIGAEGMGLYQMIFSVYVLAYTFAASGLSTAVTRLVTDELVCGTKQSVLKILRRAVTITVAAGAAVNAAVYFGANFIAEYWIRDMRAASALKILSFSLIFMGVSSCFKGYFMARRKAFTPCASQIFEQAVRIAAVMYLLSIYADRGIEYACFAVLCADTVAEVCSCAFLYICCRADKRRLKVTPAIKCRPCKKITAAILKIAAPIIAGRYLNSILRTVENLSVPGCLARHSGTREGSLATFGALKGMAMPIIFFPSSFLMSMSTLLIPEISEANALCGKEKIQRSVSKAIRITLILSILISGIFSLTADALGMLIYNSPETGFLIRVLAPLIPAMYLECVIDGILKGLGQQNRSLAYSAADSILRIVLIFTLVPRFGMAGFLGMMIFSNIFTSYLNLHRLIKVSELKFDAVNWLLKPIVSIILACLCSTLLVGSMKSGKAAFILLSAAVITAVYFAIMFLCGALKTAEISLTFLKQDKPA